MLGSGFRFLVFFNISCCVVDFWVSVLGFIFWASGYLDSGWFVVGFWVFKFLRFWVWGFGDFRCVVLVFGFRLQVFLGLFCGVLGFIGLVFFVLDLGFSLKFVSDFVLQ